MLCQNCAQQKIANFVIWFDLIWFEVQNSLLWLIFSNLRKRGQPTFSAFPNYSNKRSLSLAKKQNCISKYSRLSLLRIEMCCDQTFKLYLKEFKTANLWFCKTSQFLIGEWTNLEIHQVRCFYELFNFDSKIVFIGDRHWTVSRWQQIKTKQSRRLKKSMQRQLEIFAISHDLQKQNAVNTQLSYNNI